MGFRFGECSSRSYIIKLDDENNVIKLTNDDHELDDKGSPTVYNQLINLPGVDEIDWNGHFGNHVYLRIEAKHDTEVTWKRIKLILKDYLP